jgi:hypothetical protein
MNKGTVPTTRVFKRAEETVLTRLPRPSSETHTRIGVVSDPHVATESRGKMFHTTEERLETAVSRLNESHSPTSPVQRGPHQRRRAVETRAVQRDSRWAGSSVRLVPDADEGRQKEAYEALALGSEPHGNLVRAAEKTLSEAPVTDRLGKPGVGKRWSVSD